VVYQILDLTFKIKSGIRLHVVVVSACTVQVQYFSHPTVLCRLFSRLTRGLTSKEIADARQNADLVSVSMDYS
jgi:hypothetical protein